MFKKIISFIKLTIALKRKVPKKIASMEDGLRHICTRWSMIAPILAESPIGKFGINKIYNIVVREGASYQLHIRRHDATFLSGTSEVAHATIELDEKDWSRIFRGEINLAAAVAAGRGLVQCDQQNTVFALGLIINTLVTI
jgi:hypothetical protein